MVAAPRSGAMRARRPDHRVPTRNHARSPRDSPQTRPKGAASQRALREVPARRRRPAPAAPAGAARRRRLRRRRQLQARPLQPRRDPRRAAPRGAAPRRALFRLHRREREDDGRADLEGEEEHLRPPAEGPDPALAQVGAQTAEFALQQEALHAARLGRAIPRAWRSRRRRSTQPDHRVAASRRRCSRTTARPKADAAQARAARGAEEADDSDRPQIVWALVTLKEPRGLPAGDGRVPRGPPHEGRAPRRRQRLRSRAARRASCRSTKLAEARRRPSASVRQLVATVLSRNAEPKWTSALVKLVKDKDPRGRPRGRQRARQDRRREARAARCSRRSRAPTRTAARSSSRRSATASAARASSLALDSVEAEKPEETQWFQTKQIMDMLRELADPRVGDALVKWVETSKPLSHWQTEAGAAPRRGRRHPRREATSASA